MAQLGQRVALERRLRRAEVADLVRHDAEMHQARADDSAPSRAASTPGSGNGRRQADIAVRK